MLFMFLIFYYLSNLFSTENSYEKVAKRQAWPGRRRSGVGTGRIRICHR